jgi:hypothetical protein
MRPNAAANGGAIVVQRHLRELSTRPCAGIAQGLMVIELVPVERPTC